jgi:hypothetical protein
MISGGIVDRLRQRRSSREITTDGAPNDDEIEAYRAR